jgi:hypothetical protein
MEPTQPPQEPTPPPYLPQQPAPNTQPIWPPQQPPYPPAPMQSRPQGAWQQVQARTSGWPPIAKVAVAAGASLIVLCLVCAMCGGILNAIGGGSRQGDIAVSETFTPRPSTAAAKPTNTAGPTATATKPPTPEQQIQALVAAQLKKDGQTTDGLKVTIDSDRIVTVEHDASDNLTGDFIKIGIQLDAFSVMKAIWTQWPANLGAKPSQVTFKDMGDTKDKYGNNSRGAWGTAVLYAETAALFNWSGLDRQSAWDAYDVKYYISGL